MNPERVIQILSICILLSIGVFCWVELSLVINLNPIAILPIGICGILLYAAINNNDDWNNPGTI